MKNAYAPLDRLSLIALFGLPRGTLAVLIFLLSLAISYAGHAEEKRIIVIALMNEEAISGNYKGIEKIADSVIKDGLKPPAYEVCYLGFVSKRASARPQPSPTRREPAAGPCDTAIDKAISRTSIYEHNRTYETLADVENSTNSHAVVGIESIKKADSTCYPFVIVSRAASGKLINQDIAENKYCSQEDAARDIVSKIISLDKETTKITLTNIPRNITLGIDGYYQPLHPILAQNGTSFNIAGSDKNLTLRAGIFFQKKGVIHADKQDQSINYRREMTWNAWPLMVPLGMSTSALLPLGFGIYGLALNGKCVTDSELTTYECAGHYSTRGIGLTLTLVGLVIAGSGWIIPQVFWQQKAKRS